MQVQEIALDNFRGYRHLRLEQLGQLNVIVGENAVGKTNIVEALRLLTAGESFRRPHASELPSWGHDALKAGVVFADGIRKVEHEMRIKDGKKLFYINGKKKGSSDLRKTCPSVLFIPDDLQMVKASSAVRRNSIDMLAQQLSPQFTQVKREYANALKQRNLLLREELATGPLLDSWNESMIVHGARLYTNRVRLFERLKEHMKRIYERVVDGENFEAVYVPSWDRFDEEGRQLTDTPGLHNLEVDNLWDLQTSQEKMGDFMSFIFPMEQLRHTSLAGPHKDEIAFFVNGKNARLFASQGQQRTIVLVWKLAEVSLIREMTGQEPILLLDDVMSEFDEKHRDALTWFIEHSAQAFITTTNLGYFSNGLLDGARIIKLPIEGTRYEYGL